MLKKNVIEKHQVINLCQVDKKENKRDLGSIINVVDNIYVGKSPMDH